MAARSEIQLDQGSAGKKFLDALAFYLKPSEPDSAAVAYHFVNRVKFPEGATDAAGGHWSAKVMEGLAMASYFDLLRAEMLKNYSRWPAMTIP